MTDPAAPHYEAQVRRIQAAVLRAGLWRPPAPATTRDPPHHRTTAARTLSSSPPRTVTDTTTLPDAAEQDEDRRGSSAATAPRRPLLLPLHSHLGGDAGQRTRLPARCAVPQTFVHHVCDSHINHSSGGGSEGGAHDPVSCTAAASAPASASVFADLITRAWGAEAAAAAVSTSAAAPSAAVWTGHGGATTSQRRPDVSCSSSSDAVLMSAGPTVAPPLSHTSAQTTAPARAASTPPLHLAARSAGTHRVVSAVRASAPHYSSASDRCTGDAARLAARGHATDAATTTPAPPAQHAVLESQRRRQLLQAVQQLDGALYSGGISEAVRARRWASLQRTLAGLCDADGRPLTPAGERSGAALRRLRQRLVCELLGTPLPPRCASGPTPPSRVAGPPRSVTAARVSWSSSSPPCAGVAASGGDALHDRRHAATDAAVEEEEEEVPPASDRHHRAAVCVGTLSPSPSSAAAASHERRDVSPSAMVDLYRESEQRFRLETAALVQAQRQRRQRC
ncbi:hypothetical protein NESM_000239900 [Novymonas esmeraldas]|uniref:Uncharacterized protein n=1 Tax=Novymonas esmeraldas TaxID=1808958 RepID=A0AAW0F860_9TRYP